ncbi:hypothetical protein FOA43_001435 [Brettanomyces nanus]|uniref:rRNA methyltransferase 1, mitochondrial n=1 Tax=Eeniella nana TaxID=13502 RepID=A0A875RZM4_EENNA|nr:uncharacterized protein FOA43_001435 [Brettanomyces nanus]QPG74113.1 hypothetical protein FOA43_001435 [Brettanomyces nanus]
MKILRPFSRSLHNYVASLASGPKAPFQTQFSATGKPAAFEKNMPVYRRTKAWEKDGMKKEEWFKKKYAGRHAEEKEKNAEREARYKQGVKQRNSTSKMSIKQTVSKLQLNHMQDYLYGTNPVLAALSADSRESFGKLYLHNPKDTDKINEILKIAEEKNIEVVSDASKQDLNQMADNGVHNGVVLVSRPMQTDDLECLLASTKESIVVKKKGFDTAYLEEIDKRTDPERYPIGLYLDEISDPHNVGAILRSAYFLGADFVVMSEKNCASLTPLVSKTSSGAMEFLPIFFSAKPLKFFEDSSHNGWSIVSSLAPSHVNKYPIETISQDDLGDLSMNSPVLLVVGSEGSGIRRNLINRSTYVVGLEAKRLELDESVDSLNVSVATALLISKATN